MYNLIGGYRMSKFIETQSSIILTQVSINKGRKEIVTQGHMQMISLRDVTEPLIIYSKVNFLCRFLDHF